MDEVPLSKQIEHVRNLIAAKEEHTAVANSVDFYTLKNIRIDIRLLKEY